MCNVRPSFTEGICHSYIPLLPWWTSEADSQGNQFFRGTALCSVEAGVIPEELLGSPGALWEKQSQAMSTISSSDDTFHAWMVTSIQINLLYGNFI